MSAANTTPTRPAPIDFKREPSSYNLSNNANATNTAEDPRSPGVPRTPGGAKKTNANKTPSKGASSSRAIPEPESPLAGFITQTDASGTPTWKANGTAGAGAE
eukprot:CAMPEP_0171951884 /NCGR_PEP_ID=MMETSP0993-20121228/86553_1 /TAXON_ID=483369 /ORGANISM="non described non described, Strain CCMP2098" /LENGTH=102 /DNA_ID=CAMNT_0012597141 /DNA_START=93 /DNA_END=398 /DNA_ORIENTATION=-